MTLNFELGLDF